MLKIYEKIVKDCDKRSSSRHPLQWSGRCDARDQHGFKLVTILNDIGLLSISARSHIAQTRKEFGGKA